MRLQKRRYKGGRRRDAYDVLNRAVSYEEETASRVRGTEITKMGVPHILRELKDYFDSTAAIYPAAERATVYTRTLWTR